MGYGKNIQTNMIQKVSSSEVKQYTPHWDKHQPSFTGVGEVFLQGMQVLEKYPMLNVSALDLSTAIIPRTVIETKESNAFAGMEAFRRESSGLIVNCLLPSFIVMGAAKLLEKPIMKTFGKASLSNIWANEESLNLIQRYMQGAKGTGSEKIEDALQAFLKDVKGIDGSEWKNFKDFDLKGGIKAVVESTDRKTFNKGFEQIANTTHMTEHLVHDGKTLSKNLQGMIEDFIHVGRAIEKEGIKDSTQLANYVKRATKLVNAKSLAGLGVIIPLAISMQPINRWITSKQSGVKGAPIYKDYTESTDNKELTHIEKRDLFKQKIISIASMLGVAFLSMGMKLPNKQMLQFKGIFPTMDQARLISTATFASRMAASEDKNELREATIRDIATFSSLYFLGDYAAKAVATLIEKVRPDVKLLNKLTPTPENAGGWKKFTHWLKDVSLKSSEEVATKTAKNFRTVCHLGNLAFSLLVLGLFIPLYNRTQTNKKREAELKKMAESINSTDGFLKDQIKTQSPAFKAFFQ